MGQLRLDHVSHGDALSLRFTISPCIPKKRPDRAHGENVVVNKFIFRLLRGLRGIHVLIRLAGLYGDGAKAQVLSLSVNIAL